MVESSEAESMSVRAVRGDRGIGAGMIGRGGGGAAGVT